MGVWVCKKEKRLLEELGKGTTFRIHYIKNDYSIKKKEASREGDKKNIRTIWKYAHKDQALQK